MWQWKKAKIYFCTKAILCLYHFPVADSKEGRWGGRLLKWRRIFLNKRFFPYKRHIVNCASAINDDGADRWPKTMYQISLTYSAQPPPLFKMSGFATAIFPVQAAVFCGFAKIFVGGRLRLSRERITEVLRFDCGQYTVSSRSLQNICCDSLQS